MDTYSCTVMGLRQGFAVVREQHSLVHVIECLWASGAEHAAVVDGRDKLRGVLSVRDILDIVAEAFEEQGLLETSRMEGVFRLRALEVASANVVSLPEASGLEEAVCVMAERGIGFVPLVDNEGRLVGGYTEVDVASRLEYSSEPAIGYGTRRLITLDPQAPLVEALGLMAGYRVRRIPVVGGDATRIAYVNDLLYAASLGGTDLTTPLRSLDLPPASILPSTATLGQVASTIARSRERAVILVDGDRLVAIVTERDLLNAYARRLAC